MARLGATQPWYANNAVIMEKRTLIVEYFNALTLHRPRYGFFLEPDKLILVVKEGYGEAEACFFLIY